MVMAPTRVRSHSVRNLLVAVGGGLLALVAWLLLTPVQFAAYVTHSLY